MRIVANHTTSTPSKLPFLASFLPHNNLKPLAHTTITMEDLDPNAPVPGVDAPTPEDGLPTAGNDNGDPLAPEVEEEHEPDPPIGEPHQDVDATGENEVDKDDLDNSDADSLLSDVDEDQFQDFDPNAISLEDRERIDIDEDNVKLLGVHKRKRAEGEGDDAGSRKKKKERRRDKSSKKERRKRRDGSEPFSGGEELDGKRRSRKRADDGEGGSSQRRRREEVDDSTLTPEERKRKELDRKMDEALRSGKTRISKKDGIVRATLTEYNSPNLPY